MSFRMIEAKKSQRSVSLLCRVLGVSRSGYYAWQSRPPSERRRADDALAETINDIYKGSGNRYGAPKIHAELADDHEIFVGRKRVARLMRQEGIVGVTRGKKWRTTTPDPATPPAPDLVERDFTATAPDQLWVADLTYIRTDQGFLYLAVVIDVFSRMIVGWSMRADMKADLVIDALSMAVGRRRPDGGLMHHSDRGSQYTSLAFGRELKCIRHSRVDGIEGRCLRQRRSRELHGDHQVRTHGFDPLPDQARSQDGDLRLHRGLLQPPAPALSARIQKPARVRADPRYTRISRGQCGLTKTVHETGAASMQRTIELRDYGERSLYLVRYDEWSGGVRTFNYLYLTFGEDGQLLDCSMQEQDVAVPLVPKLTESEAIALTAKRFELEAWSTTTTELRLIIDGDGAQRLCWSVELQTGDDAFGATFYCLLDAKDGTEIQCSCS